MAKRATRKVKEPEVPVEEPGPEVEAEAEPELEAEAQAEPEPPNEPAEPEASVEALEPEAETEAEWEREVEVQAELQAPKELTEPETRLLWGYRCINCNQNSQPIEATEDGYHCPVCDHDWTDADEQAPFRRVQRGER